MAQGFVAFNPEQTEQTERTDDDLPSQKSGKKKPQRFGYQYFEGARKRILRLEQELQTNGIPQAKIQDAIGGFVGPIEMMQGNVNAQIPHNRILAPGDKLTLISWSDQTSLEKSTIVVDAQGYAILPQVGKLVVRGMTLTQFEKIAQEALSHKQFTDLKVVASFTELHTIQIFITGWVFRPGTYATSSVTSVFNALYLSGGPSESGALRNIHLIRNGETTHIDFYQYLMKGDSSQDIPLVAGDTIYIAPVEKLVEISGEVRRPGAYEVLPDDNFDVLLEMAGDIKPTGFAKRIQINTVLPNEERILREVNVSKKTNPPIFHGDEVLVLPIRDEILNIVHIEGLVKRSGIYELKPGMRIANLIKRAEGLAGEAFSDRADLFRLNEDEKTTVLIPLNLRKALAEDTEHNLEMKSRDRLVVYSKFEVDWYSERIVRVEGDVTKSGSYERSDQMRISDLLTQAGGLKPTAYLPRATLFRLNQRQQMVIAVTVNLEQLQTGIKSQNILLVDGDTLMIHRFDEVEWHAKKEVTITGHIHKPGIYPRLDNMSINDLIFHSGGLLPNSDNIALVLRRDRKWVVSESIKVDLTAPDQANLRLEDGDNLIIYTKPERKWQAKREVIISGAVQNPGVYERVDNMTVSDLLFRAGGTLPSAYLDRAYLQRFLPDQERTKLVPVNLKQVHDGVENADFLLQNKDSLTVSTFQEVAYYPKPNVTIYGAVQLPGEYDYQEGMKLADLLFLAGGKLPNARETAEVARAFGAEQTQIIKVDLNKLLDGDNSQNITLNSRDVVTIPSLQNFREDPLTVTISGQVAYPGVYTIQPQDRLSDLINRAGGLTNYAFPAGAVFSRKEEKLIDKNQLDALERTIKQVEAEKEYEYIRELAKSQRAYKREDVADGLEQTVTSVAQLATTSATPLAAVGQLGNLTQELNSEGTSVSSTSQPVDSQEKAVPIVPIRYSINSGDGVKLVDDNNVLPSTLAEKAENSIIDPDLPNVDKDVEKTELFSEENPLSGLNPDHDLTKEKIPNDTVSPEDTAITPEMTTQVGIHLVTPARKIKAMIPSRRILINLPQILTEPHSGIDPLLEDQDEIYVPQIRQTILVTGGVLHPSSFIFRKGLKSKDYIEMAGGFARDADTNGVYLLKANGLAYRGKNADRIENGDVIVVPTRVMVERVNERWDQIFSVVRLTLVTVTTAYLVGQFTK